MIHAVMDTCVLIAALRSKRGASFELLRRIGDGSWRLHLSVGLFLEYEEIANREAHKFWLDPNRIEDVLDYLCSQAEENSVKFRWRPFLPDADDDLILELAVAAQARYIITHNVKHFAGVEDFGIEAITPHEMLLKLE